VESRLNQVKSLIDRFIVEVGKRAYKDSNSGKDTELEDLAQNKFKEALEFNPNNTEAIYYLGLVEVTKHNNTIPRRPWAIFGDKRTAWEVRSQD
jgi:lipoprotein NlpI